MGNLRSARRTLLKSKIEQDGSKLWGRSLTGRKKQRKGGGNNPPARALAPLHRPDDTTKERGPALLHGAPDDAE